MVNTKSPELVEYHQFLINRIPSNVTDAFRMAIIDVIEKRVEFPDPNDCNLLWYIQNEYENDREPKAAEVVALALCYEKGAIEGGIYEIQQEYYAKHSDLAHNIHKWTIAGIAGQPVQETDESGTASPDAEFADPYDSLQQPDPFTDPSESSNAKGKRKVSDEDDEAAKRARLSRLSHNDYTDNEDTPLLNKLMANVLAPPKKSSKKGTPKTAASSSRNQSQDANPGPTANLMVTSFPRVPMTSNHAATSDRNNTGQRQMPVTPNASSRRTRTSPVENPEAAKTAQTQAIIDVLHKQATDKLAHAEALRKENSAALDQRPADMDLAALTEHVTHTNGLNSRIHSYHESAIKDLSEAVRLQREQDNASFNRLNHMESILSVIGSAARCTLSRTYESEN
ncbi:hypothetical protein GCG54_00007394 [Colletotrichum gloeosporioides]|uniref:Uncharacterized protein n=1 Tax=Colletotrichum gloeosporioides TaxID=474922 RepID=A0A8H4CPS9_COLGL|nr:uncharacterized protein GCG54_00007394 [Colletotrichum gloeosporioides]KAF3807661.1 hypothetical protein GCG54_00007394 [Colletotrichum gloeosporioides]